MQAVLFSVLAALHAVPALRLVLSLWRAFSAPFTDSKPAELAGLISPKGGMATRLSHILRRAARESEYALCFPRFYLATLPLTLYVLIETARHARGGHELAVPSVAIAAVLAALGWYGRAALKSARLKLVEYLRIHPRLHPDDFFTLFKTELAFGTRDVFAYRPAREISPFDADFRGKGRAEQTPWPVLVALLDTIHCTYFIVTALRTVGPHYAKEVSDTVGCVWGKRILALARGRLLVEGGEKLKGLNGRFLLISNHMSSLDFVFTFFALSEIPVNGRSFRPRFIVAKDHFMDNPVIYRMLGLGRAIEIMDMVFIERKNRDKSFANLRDAAVSAVEKQIDIAVYPQGTRAMGNFDRAGKRRDAGYYTTVSSKSAAGPLAHLKKGTGYLIYDILDELRRRGGNESLHLVFIGIRGTANALPRESLTVQTENTMHYTVGDVVSLQPDALPDAPDDESAAHETKAGFADRMNRLIDESLSRAMNLHASLKKRFLADLKGSLRFEPDKIDAIERALTRLAEEDSGVFQIIDRIYSLPPQEWNGYLSQLCQLLQGRIDEPERFRSILDDVSQRLVA